MKIKFENLEKILLILTVFLVYLFNYNITNGIYKLVNVAIIIFILFEFLYSIKNKKVIIYKNFYFLLFFFTVCCISILYSISTSLSIYKVKTLIVLIIFFIFLVSYILREKNNLDFILKTLIIVNIIGTIYVVISSNWLEGLRSNGIVGDANQAGAYFAYSCTLSLYYLYFCKCSRNMKFLCIISIILSVLVNLIGGSRSALITTIIGISFFYILKDKNSLKTIKNIIFVIILLIVVVNLVEKIPVFYNIVGIRFKSMFEIIQGKTSSINESSTDTRIMLIKTAYNLFSRNIFTILFGNGIGSFQEYSRINLNFDAFSHNNYLELLSGVGLFGFISYYLFYFNIFRESLKKYFIEKSKKYAALIAIVTQIFISHFFVVFYYQKLEFIFLAIIAAIFIQNKEVEKNE